MTTEDFWESIKCVISDGFTPEGLNILDIYAEHFINEELIYHRFSLEEQRGCSEGGATNVIASLLAAASSESDSITAPIGSFKREQQLAAAQERVIETWAQKTGCWIDNCDNILSDSLGAEIAEGGEAKVYFNGSYIIKSIRLDYYIQPILALDRVSLHNYLFKETSLSLLGFGRTSQGDFCLIVSQPWIQGNPMEHKEIADFALKIGFKEINPKNWTYATQDIYLSDLHDENVIKSKQGNFFVIDCDIRINIPELKCDGRRKYNNKITSLTDLPLYP